MNKFLLLPALAAAMLLASCSGNEKFGDSDRVEIFVDGILPEVDGDTLFLYEYISIDSKDGSKQAGLRDLDRYLLNYYWVVDGDTVWSARPKRKVSYGNIFVELVLIDIWGDTLRYADSLFIKEPLRVSLLSPVDSFSLSENGAVKFEYKISGTDKEEAKSFVFIYKEDDYAREACEEDGCEDERDSSWAILRNNRTNISESVSWKVMALANKDKDTAFSETRKIWLRK